MGKIYTGPPLKEILSCPVNLWLFQNKIKTKKKNQKHSFAILTQQVMYIIMLYITYNKELISEMLHNLKNLHFSS